MLFNYYGISSDIERVPHIKETYGHCFSNSSMESIAVNKRFAKKIIYLEHKNKKSYDKKVFYDTILQEISTRLEEINNNKTISKKKVIKKTQNFSIFY